jgi:threonine/homoserine efflux transporter RhtA
MTYSRSNSVPMPRPTNIRQELVRRLTSPIWLAILIIGVGIFAAIDRSNSPKSPLGLALLALGAVAFIGLVAWVTTKVVGKYGR